MRGILNAPAKPAPRAAGALQVQVYRPEGLLEVVGQAALHVCPSVEQVPPLRQGSGRLHAALSQTYTPLVQVQLNESAVSLWQALVQLALAVQTPSATQLGFTIDEAAPPVPVTRELLLWPPKPLVTVLPPALSDTPPVPSATPPVLAPQAITSDMPLANAANNIHGRNSEAVFIGSSGVPSYVR